MNVDADVFAQLPAVRRFAIGVRQALMDQKHVILVLGQTLTDSCRQALVSSCLEGSHYQEVEAGDLPEGGRPEALLMTALQCAEADVTAGARTRVSEGFLPPVIALQGLFELDQKRQEVWLGYLARVAKFGWAIESRLLFTAKDTAMVGDSTLAIFHFWSELSSLDVQLLCREAAGGTLDLKAAWREAIIPELVGSELSLIPALWDAVLRGEEAVVEALKQASAQRAWDPVLKRAMASLQRNLAAQPTATCPAAWRPLWAAGAASGTCDHGGLLSSAALVWTEQGEDRKALRHRLWRGQAALLLPRLDELRLKLCQRLTEQHGAGWPTRLHTFRDPDEADRVQRDPLSVEFGALALITKKPFARAPHLAAVAAHARELRNDLAHYSPVSFSRFQELAELQARALA